MLGVAGVCGDGEGFLADVLDALGELIEGFGVSGGEDEVVAFAGEEKGGCLADALGGAGDQGGGCHSFLWDKIVRLLFSLSNCVWFSCLSEAGFL